MNIDVKVYVRDGKIAFNLPQLGVSDEMADSFMMTPTGIVLGIGVDPEEEKRFLIESLANISDKDFMKSLQAFTLDVNLKKIDRSELKRLKEYDELYGTEKAWGLLEEYITFFYPFHRESFDPEKILNFIVHFRNELVGKSNGGIVKKLTSWLFNTYNYKLKIANYHELTSRQQQDFEELMKGAKSFLKAKSFSINDKYLY